MPAPISYGASAWRFFSLHPSSFLHSNQSEVGQRNRADEPLASIQFAAEIIIWRGPAPYLFVPIPDEHIGEIRYASQLVSHGWGVIPVEARIGSVEFRTSLFPKDGLYLLPIKVAVQRAAGVGVGDMVDLAMLIKR